MPPLAFNKHGPEKGPQIMPADDADSVINALRQIMSVFEHWYSLDRRRIPYYPKRMGMNITEDCNTKDKGHKTVWFLAVF